MEVYKPEECLCKICKHVDYTYPIIGLIGARGSGKTTCAAYLQANYNFQEFSFADPVKKVVEIIYGFDYDTLKGDTPERREARVNMRDPMWNQNMIQAMQFIGTELFRNHMDQDVWIKIMKRNIDSCIKSGKRVVISDLRYPNEIEFVRSLGGKIFVIESQSAQVSTCADNHSSETSAKDAIKDTDIVLMNDFKNVYFENIKKIMESLAIKK